MRIPVLMIPGLNATPRVFHNQMETLWRHGPVMVADHRRGIDMREIAMSILADAPRRFALVAFSMGGYIAFEILRQAPERVAALALVSTSARPDTPEATEKRHGAIKLAEAGRLEQVATQSFPSVVHPAHRDDAALKATHRDMARFLGADVFIQHQKAIMARPDSRPGLSAIAVPTVVIVGEGDEVAPPEAAREMADGISGAELHVVAGAGHLALLEQPEQVNAALDAWLTKALQADGDSLSPHPDPLPPAGEDSRL